ncbi:MAG: TrmH family RNA methyltransferase [Candidatus Gastranaerophilaceae bacterium]
MEITSVNNSLVKEAVKLQQKKYRDIEKKFLLEGFKAVEEAYISGLTIEKVFVEKNKKGKYLFLGCEFIETTESVLKKISTTNTPPEVVAIAIQPKNNKENAGKNVLLLENIRDLGNLGTIIRTSVAFGVDSIVLYGDTVDLYNPKVVRSAVGNLWKINIIHIQSFADIKKYFSDYERYATLPKFNNSEYLSNITFDKNKQKLVMFGSEADGLSEELKSFATKNITIEMEKNVESLNLSISAGIVAYKLFN